MIKATLENLTLALHVFAENRRLKAEIKRLQKELNHAERYAEDLHHEMKGRLWRDTYSTSKQTASLTDAARFTH